MDAVVQKVIDTLLYKVRRVAEDASLEPEEKLLQVFLAMRMEEPEEEGLLEEMHKTENVLLHQKTLVSTVTALTPILKQVVEEGMEKGVFCCEYPKQYMQIFITSAVTLLDDGIFPIEPDQAHQLFEAMISLLGQMLGVEKERLWEKASKYWQF